MNPILTLLDKWTEKIPPGISKVIRLAALFFWVLVAGVIATYSWVEGAQSAPPSGLDLSQARVKERIMREENLKHPPTINVPEISRLLSEEKPAIMPYSAQEGNTQTSQPPPYIGEDQSIPKEQLLPHLPKQQDPITNSVKETPLIQNSQNSQLKLNLLPVEE